MKRGDFVTIGVKDQETGEMYCIQGVYIGDNIDGTVRIQGVSGAVYRGIGDGTVVPDHNIWHSRKKIDEIRNSI